MHAIAPFPGLVLASGDWQAWAQPVAALLAVAVAAAWLTARWLIRRRSKCAGDCSRCVAHGPRVPGAGACGKPTAGIRPAGLQVLQSSTNVPRSGDV